LKDWQLGGENWGVYPDFDYINVQLSNQIYYDPEPKAGSTWNVIAGGTCLKCTILKPYMVKSVAAVLVHCPAVKSFAMVFRGTSNLRNWLTDLNLSRCPNTLGSKDKIKPASKDNWVHCGFLQILEDAHINHDISTFAATHNPSVLYVTGHSLGGALATLSAYDIVNHMRYKMENPSSIKNVYMSMFGSPRVGGQEFVDNFLALASDKTAEPHFDFTRFAMKKKGRALFTVDPITELPSEFMGYRHIPNLHNAECQANCVVNVPTDAVKLHSMDAYIQYVETWVSSKVALNALALNAKLRDRTMKGSVRKVLHGMKMLMLEVPSQAEPEPMIKANFAAAEQIADLNKLTQECVNPRDPVSKSAMQEAQQQMFSSWNSLKEMASDSAKQFSKAISSGAAKVSNTAASVANAAKSAASSVAQSAKSAASSVAQSAKSAASSLANAAKNVFKKK